jgi:sedoheptulose-bisphosphatase
MGNDAVPEGTSELIAHLRSVLPQDGTRDALITSVIPKLLQSIADVAQALRISHNVAAAGTANTFGDDRTPILTPYSCPIVD